MKPPVEPLSQALARAARALDTEQPPPALRPALLQRLAQQPSAKAGVAPTAPPARHPARRWAWSGGAAVTAVLALGTVTLLLTPPPPSAGRTASGEFLPLVPREDWPEEASPAWLVKSELPPERLAALGLPYDPTNAAAGVRAELLVHPSGLVLALRLID